MRSRFFIRNFLMGMVGQVLTALLGFAVRTVFIYTLTDAFLGINSLLSNIFSVLNLANLGIDSAIVFAMYKPMAEKDTEKSKSLLRLYRNSYRIIGAVILAAGLAITPLLDTLTHGGTDLLDLRIVYWLFLLETVCSYWFFAYVADVLSADQKNYVAVETDCVIQIILSAARIVLLLTLKGMPPIAFYAYSAAGVVCGVLRNLLVRCRTVKLYPWIRDRAVAPLPKAEKDAIFKNVAGMTTNNICRVMNDGIDSLVVSSFLGLAANGVFSNYLVIRSYVVQVLQLVFNSMTSGVGNLCAVENREKQESFFHSLQFTCFWIYGFCAICLWELSDSFIAGVWLRSDHWLLPKIAAFLIAFNFLIEGLARSVIVYRDANGLFWQARYRYIISSVFNAGFSVILVGPLHMGVTGALLGTTASLIIMISYDPVLVFRHVFGKKAGAYYLTYAKDLLLVLATWGLTRLACLPFSGYTVLHFLLRMLICLVLPNGLWYLLFRKDPRFDYLKDTAGRYVQGFLARIR